MGATWGTVPRTQLWHLAVVRVAVRGGVPVVVVACVLLSVGGGNWGTVSAAEARHGARGAACELHATCPLSELGETVQSRMATAW